MNMKKTMLAFGATAVILGGIITGPSALKAENNNMSCLEDQEVQPHFECIPCKTERIPIIREDMVDISTGEGLKTPYSPIGVSLGKGLFYDNNKNLLFVPERMKGPIPVDSQSREKYNLTRTGNQVVIVPSDRFKKSVTITENYNNAIMDPQGAWNTSVINKEPGKITIDPPGPWNNITITQKDKNTMTVQQSIGGTERTITIDCNTVTIKQSPYVGPETTVIKIK